MQFNFKTEQDAKESITARVSAPVTETIAEEIKMIKGSSKRNRKLVNELSRQFYEQVILKFRKGDFDKV